MKKIYSRHSEIIYAWWGGKNQKIAVNVPIVISESVRSVKVVLLKVSISTCCDCLCRLPFGLTVVLSRFSRHSHLFAVVSGMNIFQGRVAFIPRAAEGS